MNILLKTISIPTSKGTEVLMLNEIVRIQGLSNYCRIIFSNGRHPLIVARLLKRFEAELPGNCFIRPHRTHLVNKIFIEYIRLGRSGGHLSLRNGETIAISRRKKNMLQKVS